MSSALEFVSTIILVIGAIEQGKILLAMKGYIR